MTSDVQVIPAFERAVNQLLRVLAAAPPDGQVDIRQGDARSMNSVLSGSVDLVITSPPYLNAIDYMRGHRLSLVWLGYSLSDLRAIRSSSIGCERGPDHVEADKRISTIQAAMVGIDDVSQRHLAMIERYAGDALGLMSEIARVLDKRGRAILVVGNSCLKGTFIANSEAFVSAASFVGLNHIDEVVRELPSANRYLPMPAANDMPLGGRMRTETVLTFSKAKSSKARLN
jgi:DNA modification methylase